MTGGNGVTDPRALLLLAAGFVVWSSAFVLLYAGLSVGCAFGWDRVVLGGTSAVRLGLLLVWAGHIAALAALVIYTHRRAMRATGGSRPSAFTLRLALALSVAALVATVWTGLAIPVATLCA